jgi:hypothetical protein
MVLTASFNLRPGWLAGIAEDIDDGAIFVKRGALASSGSAGNVLYFFGRQLTSASASQYPVRHDLLQHVLLLSGKDGFSQQMETDTSNINELKKNRSLLQRFRWNFHHCDSQNGREKMQEDELRISTLLLLFTNRQPLQR